MLSLSKRILKTKLDNQSGNETIIDISFVNNEIKESILSKNKQSESVTYIINDTSIALCDPRKILLHIKQQLAQNKCTLIKISNKNLIWRKFSRWAKLNSRLFRAEATSNRYSNSDIDSLAVAMGFRRFKRQHIGGLPFTMLNWLDIGLNRFLLRLPLLRVLNANSLSFYTPCQEQHSIQCKSVTVVIPARNESGNIHRLKEATHSILSQIPNSEVIFVEGNSQDNTYACCQELAQEFPSHQVKLLKQDGKGKRNAVEKGFEVAKGEYLAIIDADLTVDLEDSIQAIKLGMNTPDRLINCARLNFPMEKKAMRFFNYIGNRGFAILLSYICNQTISDSLCGTKCLSKDLYSKLKSSGYWDNAKDPFGDFSIIFGANRFGYEIINYPVKYFARTSGKPNISRWIDGLKLVNLSISEYLRP